jgi:sugar phosphate permease
LYIQGILHLSPVLTGLAFLPFPVTQAFMSTRMPGLVQRYGFKRFLVIGPLFILSALLWLSHLHIGSGYWVGILPAALLMPLGISLTIMPVIAAATSGVPSHEAGVASGLINTSQQMGGALGLSILSGISVSVVTRNAHLGSAEAAIHGYHAAFLTASAFMVLAALISLLVIRSPRKPAVESHEGLPSPELQPAVH